jgi:hypothetical protein
MGRRMGTFLAGQRLAVAAVVLYVALVLLVALPPTSRLALLVVPGVGLLVIGIRSDRTVLVGAALVLAGGGWTVRLAVGAGPTGDGMGADRAVTALALGFGLLAVAELARLAVDAGPRPGPVRVEAALRRRTLRQDAAVGGFGLLIGTSAVVLAGAGPGRDGQAMEPPGIFLTLGVLAVAGVAGVVLLLARLTSVSEPAARRPGQGGVRAARVADRGRGRWAPRHAARVIVGLVLLGAFALPALSALGARAPLPPARSAEGGVGQGGGSPAEAGPAGGLEAPTAPSTSDPTTDTPQAPPWALLGALALLGGLAILFLSGERLVSADDLRPDVAPPDGLLVGAPSAPDVRALPPEEVAAILEDALGYLRADLEPRLAVRCAYAAVAGGLGRYELGRRPAETELEFLGRQISGLADATTGRSAGDRGQALTRLTELFEVARFSDQRIDEDMRAEALAAVETLLDGSGRAPRMPR